MSTIVVVVKEGVACIAGDSLTSFGDTMQPAAYDCHHDKILQYEGNFLGIVGSAAHQIVIESLLESSAEHYDLSDRTAIFESFRSMHSVLKDDYFLNPKDEEDDAYESTRIDALIMNQYGIFGVYSLREVFQYNRFWAIGAGSDIALGAMHALYDRDVTAQEIAAVGIEASAEFNNSTALPMTIYTTQTTTT